MYRKKLVKGCLIGALAIAMAVTSLSPVMSGGAAVAQAAEEQVMIKVQFADENGDFVAGGDYWVDPIFNIRNRFEPEMPAGYVWSEKNTVSGDDFAEAYKEDPLIIYVEKEQKASQVNVVYVDEAGNNVGGGDYLVDEDGDGLFNYSELTLPEGYELVTTGDCFVSDKTITVKVKKIQKASIVNVVYVDENGKNVGGGDYLVDEDGDGVFNYSELTLPEGYELVTTGDSFVSDKTITVKVKKIRKASIVNVVYVDENGKNVGGGDYFVDEDGDGVFNYSELTLPEGYELVTTGDSFVSDKTITVKVKKIQKASIVNVIYVDVNGNNVGGGDYFVDEDGDGVFNLSELVLPEGYELAETGDCFVSDETITVKVKLAMAIVNVQFVDEAGNVIGGGDCFVDRDGDGIFNYSELASAVPAGYRMTEGGDAFVKDGPFTIKVEKINKGTIINVSFTDPQGNSLGGGDYLVDPDGDGIANYSELDLPEGYELIVTGDFFVTAGQSYTVVLRKIPEGKMINVVFVDEEGNNLGGGDYIVDEDGDGVANYSELDLPVGYELIVTGDFFVEDGGKYTITLRLRETVMTVTFEDTEGNVVGQEVLKAGVPGSPDDVYVFTLGEDFQLPEGYQLAEGVDQITDIEIPYGSVGGHTMIVEKIGTEDPDQPTDPEDPDQPTDPEDPDTPAVPEDPAAQENPGTTDDTQNTDKKQDDVKADKDSGQDAADEDKAPQTGDTASPVIPVAAGGLSLAAILGVLARKRMK